MVGVGPNMTQLHAMHLAILNAKKFSDKGSSISSF